MDLQVRASDQEFIARRCEIVEHKVTEVVDHRLGGQVLVMPELHLCIRQIRTDDQPKQALEVVVLAPLAQRSA